MWRIPGVGSDWMTVSDYTDSGVGSGYKTGERQMDVGPKEQRFLDWRVRILFFPQPGWTVGSDP